LLFHECDNECKLYRDVDHPIKNRWTIGEYEFSRCPKTYVDSEFYEWFTLYDLFKKGIMPVEGGFYNQSNKFVQIVTYIDNILEEHKQESQGGRK